MQISIEQLQIYLLGKKSTSPYIDMGGGGFYLYEINYDTYIMFWRLENTIKIPPKTAIKLYRLLGEQ
jgi:hypothetical protein